MPPGVTIMACTCLLDDEAKAQLRVSKAIEREMEQWKKDASKEFKLLLLGKKVKIQPLTQYNGVSKVLCIQLKTS